MGRRLATGGIASGVIALALACAVGCASGDDASADDQGNTPSSSNEDQQEDRPGFDPTFEEDGGTTETDGGTDGGGGGGPEPCIDDDDPGSSENAAKTLANTDDCDDKTKVVKGVLNGASDIDVYKFSMADKGPFPPCSIGASFETPTAGLEMCVFVSCLNGATKVNGCSAGVATTSGIGMKGCCAGGPSTPVPDWDCGGITDNDSATFYVRIKPTGPDQCLPYSFSYRF